MAFIKSLSAEAKKGTSSLVFSELHCQRAKPRTDAQAQINFTKP